VNVSPILAALKRHKAAVILIVLQIALTLAIVSNGLFLIGRAIEHMIRPSGADENGLILILQKWQSVSSDGGTSIAEKIDALQRADLQALRNLPDVQDVAASSSFPLLQDSNDGDISLDAERKGKVVHANDYYGDEQLLPTAALHLIAGRNFFASEIQHGEKLSGSAVIIVSKSLADQLFPGRNALGHAVYQDGKLATIVGVVERLQDPMGGDNPWDSNAVIEPLRNDVFWTGYVARVRAGRTAEAIREMHKTLFALNPMRHMPEPWAGIHSFSDRHARDLGDERGVALLMGIICLILLSVTAAGIVGLTSFWVGQRTRQIGVRRALGARKVDILRYFQIENLLIAGTGATIGVVCAFGLNLWLMKNYEMMHLPVSYAVIGVLAMLLLGQAAVLMPARRASNVPPVVATRSV
jgi:putative ABC transport system permease protein